MALKNSEIRVLVILALIILILWAFFGLLWSLLLVFTFLIYAYNFGRQEDANIRFEAVEDEANVTLYQDKLPNHQPEFQDLPFTGLQKEQFSLSSPMPLLSDVTKRLNFNASIITPFQARKTLTSTTTNNRQLGTPYLSRGDTMAYWRKSNHFSLLNSALQKPCTVKIASPDVTMNRTFTPSNSLLKRTTPDHTNPCSRASVMSALKESRKRSFVVDDEEDLELLLRPTKRRSCKPVNSEKINSTHEVTLPLDSQPLFGRLKRAGLHDDKRSSTEATTNKRSKLAGYSVSSEVERCQTRLESSHVLQKRKDVDRKSSNDASKEDSEESTSKKAKRSSSLVNLVEQRPIVAERENQVAQMVVDSTAHSVPEESEPDQDTDQQKSESKLKESSTMNSSSSERKDVNSLSKGSQKSSAEEKSADHEDRTIDKQPRLSSNTSTLKEKKRFTIPRFLTKVDSRRRAVPVYCASSEESEMPQRRRVTVKINQEQMKIDRKLAWERVKRFLDEDDDDDDDEDDEVGKTSKSGAVVVSSNVVTTCTPTLFEIPAVPVAKSIRTVTTTTQSLIAPVLATGNPRQTTRTQGGLGFSVAQSSGNVPGSTANSQSQTLLKNLLQPQQTIGSGLFTNLSGAQGHSVQVTTTTTTKQESSVTSTSLSGLANSTNSSVSGLQAGLTLTSTVMGSGKDGFQFSASSSIGNSLLTKPAKIDQTSSLSDSMNKNTPPSSFQLGSNFGQPTTSSSVKTIDNSAQGIGFSFPVLSSSNASQVSTSSVALVQGGFNFTTPSGNQNSNSSNTAPQSISKPGQISNSSAFNLATNSSQNTGVFGGNASLLTQSPFASLAKTTQSTLPSPSVSSSSVLIGQNTNTAQNLFGLKTQNKDGFGSTNMQTIPRSLQSNQATKLGSAFEASLNKSTAQAQSPFSQSTFAAQSNQTGAPALFGSTPATNAFGPQRSLQAPQSSFGLNTDVTKSQITFGSQVNQSTDKNKVGSQAASFGFGSQVNQNAIQRPFGPQATQSAFGAQLNQSTTQSPFGSQATQNAFGSQQPTQSAFGAPSQVNQGSKSSFSFAVNTAQNSSSSPFASFGNKAGEASQHATGPPSGLGFSSPASNSAAGGFNFNAAANNAGGFQFGTGSNSSFPNFGQTAAAQTTNPLATPSRPAQPTGGFNFAPGSSGMAGSPFASSTPGPAFGVANTPQGANSALIARTRPRITARRRGKK